MLVKQSYIIETYNI